MCGTFSRLDGKTVIVTGGSSGVGFETAKELAYRGARVIIASRNETKLAEARDNIRATTGNSDVDYRKLDLASLTSVRNFVSETTQFEKRVDVLINNAGAVGLPDRLTEDGLQNMMQVNYFGPFLLTYLLFPFLKISSPSKIINVSAATLYIGYIDFDHINDVNYWSSINVLANSKLAMSLFTVELARIIKDTSVTSNSFDPFLVSDTGILGNLPEIFQGIGSFFIQNFGRQKDDVAKELVHLASEDKLRVSGKHFKFCGEWFNTWLADDVDLTSKLWKLSKKLVKIAPYEDWEMQNDNNSYALLEKNV